MDADFENLPDNEKMIIHFISALSVLIDMRGGKDCNDAMQFINNHFGDQVGEGLQAQSMVSHVSGLEITVDWSFLNGFFAGAYAYREMCEDHGMDVNGLELLVDQCSRTSTYDALRRLFGIRN